MTDPILDELREPAYVRYDEASVLASRGTPTQLEEKIRELRDIIADRVECSGCGGWFPFPSMLPATAQPEAAMICRGCAAKEHWRTIIAELDAGTWQSLPGSIWVQFTKDQSDRLIKAMDAMRRMK